jgi:hypothetical protein
MHRRRPSLRALAVAALVLAPLAACGDDEPADTTTAATDATDGTDATDTTASADTTAPSGGGDTAGFPAECGEAPFLADFRAANAMSDLPVLEENGFAFEASLAVRLDPSSYTLYLADHPIEAEQYLDFETDHPAPGDTLVTVFVSASGATEPLAAGTMVSASDGGTAGRSFGLIIERGIEGVDPMDTLYNTSSGPEGTLEVLGLSDDTICVAVDYTDYEGAGSTNGVADEFPVQKQLRVVFTAPVVDF